MLSAKLLNSKASVNAFKYLAAIDFIPNTTVTFRFRLFDQESQERFTPPTTAVVKITFNKLDGTTLEKTATVIDTLDRSMWKIDLSAAETSTLLGGNVLLAVDLLGDATQVEQGWIQAALNKISTSES